MIMSTGSSGATSGLKAPSKIARPPSIGTGGGGGIPRVSAAMSTTSTASLLSKPTTTTNSSSSSLNQTVSEAVTVSSNTPQPQSDDQQFEIGERVFVNGVKPGRLAFVGTTQFKEGVWAGVVLDTVDGKNNGSVNGVSYFDCGGEMRGVFCRPNKLSRTYDPSVASDGAPAAPAPVPTQAAQVASPPQPASASGFKVGDRVLISAGAAGGPPKVGTLRYLSYDSIQLETRIDRYFGTYF